MASLIIVPIQVAFDLEELSNLDYNSVDSPSQFTNMGNNKSLTLIYQFVNKLQLPESESCIFLIPDCACYGVPAQNDWLNTFFFGS